MALPEWAVPGRVQTEPLLRGVTVGTMADVVSSTAPLDLPIQALSMFNARSLVSTSSLLTPPSAPSDRSFSRTPRLPAVKHPRRRDLQRSVVSSVWFVNVRAELNTLDPELATVWREVVGPLEGRHTGWYRHLITTLRTILDETLFRFAPANMVLSWSDNPEHVYKPGQPTWRARMEYIFRHQLNGPAAHEYERKIDSVLRIRRELNRLHKLDLAAPTHDVALGLAREVARFVSETAGVCALTN